MSAEHIPFRRGLLDGLLAQRDSFFFSWDSGYVPLLLTRPLSDVLADAARKAKAEVEERKQIALEHAALLDATDVPSRALAMNTILRAGWNPRADWELTTPGFPLDGGVEQWTDEVRGTSLVER